jgi:uncharacterized protein (DUF1697 family)
MEQLRAVFEELGFANVETFIASGNVIFDTRAASSGALERRIESSLQRTLGFDVRTFVRTASELAAIVERDAFAPGEVARAHAMYVAFLAEPLEPAARDRLLAAATGTDDFRVCGRDVYWLCRVRFSESALSGPKLEKVIGVRSTVRNVTTLRKLAAKYEVV